MRAVEACCGRAERTTRRHYNLGERHQSRLRRVLVVAVRRRLLALCSAAHCAAPHRWDKACYSQVFTGASSASLIVCWFFKTAALDHYASPPSTLNLPYLPDRNASPGIVDITVPLTPMTPRQQRRAHGAARLDSPRGAGGAVGRHPRSTNRESASLGVSESDE